MTRLAEALRQAHQLPDNLPPPDIQITPAEAVSQADVGRKGNGLQDEGALLAVFGGFNPTVRGKLVVTPTAPAAAVEQYRKLAATLHHLQCARGIKVVMLASAVPGEGKTLTATNLALTFSHSYRRRVLLIDADLRRPSMHQIFQVPNVTGLNDGLKNDVDRKLSLIQISEHLTLLPAGRPDPDPMSGLTSERMRRVIQEAAARFDWVIVDTPPVALLPDANLLAAMVDVAILVVRAGKSPYRLIQRALDAVGRDRLAGVVLNAVDDSADVAGYNYYGYYRYGRHVRRLESGDAEAAD